MAFRGVQLAPRSWNQRPEGEVADPCAHQTQGGVADGSRHAPHLAVAALGQLQREPPVRDVPAPADRRIPRRQVGRRIKPPCPRGSHGHAVELHFPRGEAPERVVVGHTLHLHPILAPVPAPRVQELVVEAGLVRQEQEALRVGVEPAKGVDRPRQAEGGKRAPAGTGFGGELREHPVGLVEGEEQSGAMTGPRTFGATANAGETGLAPRAARAPGSGMIAVQLQGPGQLVVGEVADPLPAAGEVVVELRAAALNHRDVWIKSGQYAGLRWPCIPGSDGAGVVVAAASDADPAWLGREVILNPAFFWGDDERAQGAQFQILGLPRDGTLAGRIAVPVGQLAARPAHLSWEEAAALPLAGLTAFRALFTRARLRAGERVLVTGIGGGVAASALQFAVAAGAEVWVTSGSAAKVTRAEALGARGGFLYTDAGWPEAALKRAGSFDVVVDSAGGEGFARLADVLAPGGRLVFFGATRGDAVLPVRKVFWKQLSLLGSTMGSPADWRGLLALVERHRLRPLVGEVHPLAAAGEAFARMEAGAQCGKIVLRT